MNCKDCIEIIEPFALHELEPALHSQAMNHIRICENCDSEYQKILKIEQFLREPSEDNDSQLIAGKITSIVRQQVNSPAITYPIKNQVQFRRIRRFAVAASLLFLLYGVVTVIQADVPRAKLVEGEILIVKNGTEKRLTAPATIPKGVLIHAVHPKISRIILKDQNQISLYNGASITLDVEGQANNYSVRLNNGLVSFSWQSSADSIVLPVPNVSGYLDAVYHLSLSDSYILSKKITTFDVMMPDRNNKDLLYYAWHPNINVANGSIQLDSDWESYTVTAGQFALVDNLEVFCLTEDETKQQQNAVVTITGCMSAIESEEPAQSREATQTIIYTVKENSKTRLIIAKNLFAMLKNMYSQKTDKTKKYLDEIYKELKEFEQAKTK